MRLKSLFGIQWIRRNLSYVEHLQLVGKPVPYILRLAVISVSIIVILANVAAMVILFTFDNESAAFISGGNPKQFHQELQVDLLDDYGEVIGIAHNSGNKISSILEALAYGANVIEIDVVLVRGELHAAHWSPFRFIGDRLFRGPTLAEVWGAATQADMVKLDLKNASTEMVDALVEFLSKTWRFNRDVIVATDEPEILARFAQKEPRVIRMLGISEWDALDDLLADETLLTFVDGVSIHHTLLNEDTMASLKESGLMVFAWTVNDPARMNEMVEYGVDGITTDNLAILDLLGAQRQIDITSRGPLSNILS